MANKSKNFVEFIRKLISKSLSEVRARSTFDTQM